MTEQGKQRVKRLRPTFIGRQVLGVHTTRYVCTSCHRGFTVPRNESGDGIGECDHCGCTSYTLAVGRSWGPRHRFWKDWVKSLFSLDSDNRITRQTLDCFIPDVAEELPRYLILAEVAKQKGSAAQ